MSADSSRSVNSSCMSWIPQARKPIEENIAKLSSLVTDAKTKLNGLTPVGQLSPELLIMFFSLYIAANTYEHHYEWCAWIRVTHVCRHWRMVALESPGLWTHIVARKPAAVGEFLRRSGSAPLHITVPAERPNLDALVHVLAAFDRVRNIKFLSGTYPYNKIPKVSFPDEASQLQSITLEAKLNPGERVQPIPSVFNKCDLSSLRELRLEGFQVDWSHPIFAQNLTRLYVSDSEERYQRPSMMRAMVNALASMTSLRSLEFRNIDYPEWSTSLWDPNPSTFSQAVHLPLLGHLVIRGNSSSCAYIFRLIKFLSDVTLDIKVLIKGNSKAHAQRALKFFAESLYEKFTGGERLQPPKVLYIDSFMHEITFCFSSTPDNAAPFLSVTFLDDSFEFDPVVNIVATAVPLFDIDTLLVDVEFSHTRGVWAPILVKMSHATRIILDCSAADYLPDMLSTPLVSQLANPDDKRSKGLALPNLETVRFRNAYFQPWDRSSLRELSTALQARKDNGHGVKALELIQCMNVNQMVIDELEPLVEKVIWDGNENWDSSEGEAEEDCGST